MGRVCLAFYDAIRPNELSDNQGHFAAGCFNVYRCFGLDPRQVVSAHECFSLDAFHGCNWIGVCDIGCGE